ncbi:hypothetical protein GOY07_03885 [Wolbachia endosymbiont of Litomosoides sigmodontis]|uniref:hypothetical protein n=1 Tax=Wolbachia endosymbiont of Litomosoides sigmodontis TaxID=80850 RepID=UPI00159A9E0A|nr:hypothetical protein [Wolbachia endosymbiont of Litomosoides sigmodontis]QKX03272.1 hypothetical protein GOY07_03885 [Wolbachia endosymbiont of Litomosoides sigmodontis]
MKLILILTILTGQISEIIELFNCRVRKGGNKFAKRSQAKQLYDRLYYAKYSILYIELKSLNKI